jgi:hypothetical protein
MVFDTFAAKILELAQNDENGQLGTFLDSKTYEQDERSIILKVSCAHFMFKSGILRAIITSR